MYRVQKLLGHKSISATMVTWGGLNHQGARWVKPKRNGYLFPVGALATVFRWKYLSGRDTL